jgi:hypothetical protein
MQGRDRKQHVQGDDGSADPGMEGPGCQSRRPIQPPADTSSYTKRGVDFFQLI